MMEMVSPRMTNSLDVKPGIAKSWTATTRILCAVATMAILLSTSMTGPTLAQEPGSGSHPTKRRAFKQRAAEHTPALSLTEPAVASPKPSGDIIARDGGISISAEDLRAYVSALGPRDRATLAKDPALLSETVRLLLANRLVLQRILAEKWDQTPKIAAQLQKVHENAAVELYLQSVSMPPADYPSVEDIQKAYDANRASFVVPRQYQLQQIYVAAAKSADKVAEEKAKIKLQDIQRKLRAPGADFAAIAASDSGAKGGIDLGWLAERQIRPEIRTQVAGLMKGAVSDPVRLDDGWHILKLVDTKASYTLTLPEIRDQLVQKMRSERAAMLRRAFVTELLKQHPPVLNEIAMAALLDSVRR
jgi:parvulin-like peptidyl-prolyl isomerase